MKFYLDTEFIERGPHFPVDLISMALVPENNAEPLYLVSSEFDPATASQWVKDNVLAKLEPADKVPRLSLAEIAKRVREYVADTTAAAKLEGPPTIYGYYADYDWVVFAQAFGTMMDLPKGWPMYCRDLKQTASEVFTRVGVDVIRDVVGPTPPDQEHNCLVDAQWNKKLAVALDLYKPVHLPHRTWPHGSTIPGTVEGCTPRVLMVQDAGGEMHVLVGTSHDTGMKKGQPGTLHFVKDDKAPTGAYWKFAPAFPPETAAPAA